MEQNTLDIVTCRGLCGPDCHGHTGTIADLARDLRKELRAAQYEKFAETISASTFGKAFERYPECYDLLGQMMKFRCKKGCRDGRGPPFCRIRKCCGEKKFPAAGNVTSQGSVKNWTFSMRSMAMPTAKISRLSERKGSMHL